MQTTFSEGTGNSACRRGISRKKYSYGTERRRKPRVDKLIDRQREANLRTFDARAVAIAGFRPKTIVGATMRISIPLGQYNSNDLINLGSNRWTFSPQVGASHVAGRFLLEAYTSAWFFTDNSEFLGTSTLSQKPLFAFQAHAGYRFRPGFWIAASSRQSLGGATMINGGDKLAPEANNRVGVTMTRRIGLRYSFKLAFTTGLTATAGNDYTTFAVGWQVML